MKPWLGLSLLRLPPGTTIEVAEFQRQSWDQLIWVHSYFTKKVGNGRYYQRLWPGPLMGSEKELIRESLGSTKPPRCILTEIIKIRDYPLIIY